MNACGYCGAPVGFGATRCNTESCYLRQIQDLKARLKPIQLKHFAAMSRAERQEAIRDWEKQLSMIALAPSEAADQKRAELQARIDHCQKLNSNGEDCPRFP